VRADEKLTAFVELEVQLAVKGIAFYEKACFASVARCTTKVPYTALGSADTVHSISSPDVSTIPSAGVRRVEPDLRWVAA
jgi:hypothetical protein